MLAMLPLTLDACRQEPVVPRGTLDFFQNPLRRCALTSASTLAALKTTSVLRTATTLDSAPRHVTL